MVKEDKVVVAVEKPVNKFALKGRIKVGVGSITNPESSGLRLILLPVRIDGTFEGVLAEKLTKTWLRVREGYKGWYSSQSLDFKLGAVKDLMCASDIWVVYMLCQDKKGKTSQETLETCLKEISKLAKWEKATVHLDTSTKSLSKKMDKMLTEIFIDQGVSVYTYE